MNESCAVFFFMHQKTMVSEVFQNKTIMMMSVPLEHTLGEIEQDGWQYQQ